MKYYISSISLFTTICMNSCKQYYKIKCNIGFWISNNNNSIHTCHVIIKMNKNLLKRFSIVSHIKYIEFYQIDRILFGNNSKTMKMKKNKNKKCKIVHKKGINLPRKITINRNTDHHRLDASVIVDMKENLSIYKRNHKYCNMLHWVSRKWTWKSS